MVLQREMKEKFVLNCNGDNISEIYCAPWALRFAKQCVWVAGVVVILLIFDEQGSAWDLSTEEMW